MTNTDKVKYYEGFSYLPTTGYKHQSLVNF
jgi:hypothetical protein